MSNEARGDPAHLTSHAVPILGVNFLLTASLVSDLLDGVIASASNASFACIALLVAVVGGAACRDRQPVATDDRTSRSAAEILLGRPYAGPAQAVPRGADGKPVLTGYWKLLHEDGKPDGNLGKDRPGFALPYTAKGKEVLALNDKTVDPEARCIITGIPRLLTSVLPFEILHTPQRLGTFHALSWHRWVWLDGRARDADQDPRYLGNAIGRWDGDTLVIESSGFHDSADGNVWLDDNANPISAQATVVERWTRPDFHHLNLELTYTDPVYYTEPIVLSTELRARRTRRRAGRVLVRVEHAVGRDASRAGPGNDWPQRQSRLRSGQSDRAGSSAGIGLRLARNGLLAVSQEQAEAVRPAWRVSDDCTQPVIVVVIVVVLAAAPHRPRK